MTTTRRQFLEALSAGGGALILGLPTRGQGLRKLTPSDTPLAPNQWLRIGADGSITLVAHKSEMGQGVRTSLPMILAEELGADWSRVQVVHARPGPEFTRMGTSGSGSVSGSWRPLRLAAAAAREMLIAAAAARWNVAATECRAVSGQIIHSPSNRSVAFGDLVDAASQLPVPANPPLKSRDEFRLLGTRVAAVDLPGLISGQAVFAADVRLPGMRFAVLARNPVHGRAALRVDDSAAAGVPGVDRVIPLAGGVAVVGTSTWAALRGRAALRVDWEPATDPSADSAGHWRRLERSLATGGKRARAEGDLARVMDQSVRRLEAEYRWPFQAHAAIEPLCCVADVRDGRCEIWAGTQSPNRAQTAVVELLGIPPERVTLNVTLLGGGFGRRLAHDYILQAVEISRAVGGPVQLQWTREDDMTHDMYQSSQINRLTAGLDGSGRPIAWLHQVADFHLSMFGPFDPGFNPAADGDPWGGFDMPYAFDAIQVELALTEAPVPTGAWRSVTYPPAVMARECFLDEIAHATGQDPVALRLALLPSPGRVRVGSGELDNGNRLRRVVSLAAERAGWSTSLPREREGRRWGRGFACNAYHQQTMVAQVAEISVGRDGDLKVHRVVSAVDCGQVINRSGLDAQFEGGVLWALAPTLRTEITFRQGRTVQQSFADYPILRIAEAPVVEVYPVDSAQGPFGIGEQPVPAVAPAVLNAIFAATGRRIRQVPVESILRNT